MRALLLESRAPGVGIGASAVALVAHVGKLLAQLCHKLVGAVAERGQGMALLALLYCIGRRNGWIDPVHLGRIDLPLAVLVPGGGNLARFDRAQHGRLVHATGVSGGAEGVVGHGAPRCSLDCEQWCAVMVDEPLLNCAQRGGLIARQRRAMGVPSAVLRGLRIVARKGACNVAITFR